ncbi:hypothetical protein [Enterococcus rivorum]|nr:hypothetical protein [Enterococcus rivorum]
MVFFEKSGYLKTKYILVITNERATMYIIFGSNTEQFSASGISNVRIQQL